MVETSQVGTLRSLRGLGGGSPIAIVPGITAHRREAEEALMPLTCSFRRQVGPGYSTGGKAQPEQHMTTTTNNTTTCGHYQYLVQPAPVTQATRASAAPFKPWWWAYPISPLLLPQID